MRLVRLAEQESDAMALPNLGTLSFRPAAVRPVAMMYGSDDQDAAVAPGPPAPVAAAPSIVLTEPQKRAVLQYIRKGMYQQFDWYLEGDAYPGETGEEEERKAFNRTFKRWQAVDARRMVDYKNSDARTIAQNTADEKVVKAARIITDKAREAVIEFELDFFQGFEMYQIGLRFDTVAQNAVELVEDYMRQNNTGFFDTAAEKKAIGVMADTLQAMLDPN